MRLPDGIVILFEGDEKGISVSAEYQVITCCRHCVYYEPLPNRGKCEFMGRYLKPFDYCSHGKTKE